MLRTNVKTRPIFRSKILSRFNIATSGVSLKVRVWMTNCEGVQLWLIVGEQQPIAMRCVISRFDTYILDVLIQFRIFPERICLGLCQAGVVFIRVDGEYLAARGGHDCRCTVTGPSGPLQCRLHRCSGQTSMLNFRG